MILTQLTLKDWRSYESLSVELGEGLTAILGPNGSGKTNVSEAIAYLSECRSWRVSDDSIIVRRGAHNAYIYARVKENDVGHDVSIEVGKGYKKVTVDGKPIRRMSELSRLLNVIVFSPNDVALFMGSPAERRAFLDKAIAKEDADYLRDLSEYNKLLTERNAALKGEKPSKELLELLGDRLAEKAVSICARRQTYIEALNRTLPSICALLRGERVEVGLSYHPFVKISPNALSEAKEAYRRALEEDLVRRSTGIGPQREDFSFRLNGKDVADYGSQGENRIAVFALKMCPYELSDENRKPIIVLDDALSELDDERTDRLLSYAKGLRQCFLTATKLDSQGISTIEVAPNTAIRRK